MMYDSIGLSRKIPNGPICGLMRPRPLFLIEMLVKIQLLIIIQSVKKKKSIEISWWSIWKTAYIDKKKKIEQHKLY